MVSVITPAIVMLRMEKIAENISSNNRDGAIKLCQKYVEDFEKKTTTILTQEEVNHFIDELFEIELLITLGVFIKATNQVQALNKKIVKTLVNYNMFRDRLMHDEPSDETIGSLATLPADVIRDIVDRLQNDYVW